MIRFMIGGVRRAEPGRGVHAGGERDEPGGAGSVMPMIFSAASACCISLALWVLSWMAQPGDGVVDVGGQRGEHRPDLGADVAGVVLGAQRHRHLGDERRGGQLVALLEVAAQRARRRAPAPRR